MVPNRVGDVQYLLSPCGRGGGEGAW